MMVALFHLNAEGHLYALTRHGSAGVDFFFVLSGFVLMAGYDGRLTSPMALRRFTFRRLARLYPLHLATLGVLVVIVGIGGLRDEENPFIGGFSLTALAQCLLLIQGFTSNQLAWNFPSWSISLELWASLLFGLTLCLFRTRARVVLALYALSLFLLLVVFPDPEGVASSTGEALLKAAHYILGFFAGALLFGLYGRLARWGWRPPGWLEWPALALVIATLVFADQIQDMAMIGLFAAVILVFAFETGTVSAWLNRPAPQAAGAWSYSIYLTHPLWTGILSAAIIALGARLGLKAQASDGAGGRLVLGGPFAMDLADVICLALVLFTAWLTTRWIEQPGRALAGPRRRVSPVPEWAEP
jgi:peptidoglycan/LPS O-acetylase OafA/YrhL